MLVAVAGTEEFEVIVSIGEDKLSLIQSGGSITEREVWVESDRADKQRWKARIDRLEAELEPLGRLARLAIRIDNPLAEGKNLFLGSFVRVKIAGVPFKNVFVVPDRAFNNGRVFVVDGDDRLDARSVEIVHRSPGVAFVASGLSEGDEMVVSRMRNPLVGTKVKRAQEAAKPAKGAEQAQIQDLKP